MNLLKNRYLIVLLLNMVLILPFLGRGLYESSEGRYAMVAKTMNTTKDYWHPRLNGHIHLTKPPLTYWVIATGLSLFGNTSWAARIMPSLLWILLALSMVRIVDLESDGETGLTGGLIFSTALFPVMGSLSLTTDPILLFFQGLSFLSLLEFRSSKKNRWNILFWASLGCSLNTKGPVGLFPLIFWLIFMWEEVSQLLKSPYVLLLPLLGGFWYMGLELQNPGILKRLIEDELIKRSTTDFSGRNAMWWAPLVLYILPMLLGWGLWPLFIRRKEFMIVVSDRKHRMYVTWVLITLLVFSFIQSRLLLYILPLSIPMVILIAKSVPHRRLTLALSLNAFLILGIKTWGTFWHEDDRDAERIARFAIEKSHSNEVVFLDEYLYGVEFYMGEKFRRLENYSKSRQAFKEKFPPEWLMVRKKREPLLKEMEKLAGEEYVPQAQQGTWALYRSSRSRGSSEQRMGIPDF